MALRNVSTLLLTAWGFLFSSVLAGQVIFHGQGDTPAISFRYGLLYVLSGGVPAALHGEYPFTVAVPCEILAAILCFWFSRKSPAAAGIAATLLTITACVVLILFAPGISR